MSTTKAEAVIAYWETDFGDTAHIRLSWDHACQDRVWQYFSCTRTDGHTGRHVAHDGTGRVIAHWTTLDDYVAVLDAARLDWLNEEQENTSQS